MSSTEDSTTPTSTSSTSNNEQETIALFGATGGSGSEVLSLALEKGYKVRVMVRNLSKIPKHIRENTNLTIIEGDCVNNDNDETNKRIKDTIHGCTYVISCIGGPLGKPKEFPVGAYVSFITKLIDYMSELTSTVKVFLHQSGAFVPHPDEKTYPHPFSMRVMKVMVDWIIGIGPNVQENANIMKYMYSKKDDVSFAMIATRPGALYHNDDDSQKNKKALVASLTDPPSWYAYTSFQDLAVFTLDAIKDESLYGTFPFVR